MSATPPGWYPDPDDEGSTRYWDGHGWSEERAPAPGTRQRVPGEKEREASAIIVAGYVFAVLIPIVGFVIGLTQLNKNRHALWVITLSIVIGALSVLVYLSTGEGNAAAQGLVRA